MIANVPDWAEVHGRMVSWIDGFGEPDFTLTPLQKATLEGVALLATIQVVARDWLEAAKLAQTGQVLEGEDDGEPQGPTPGQSGEPDPAPDAGQ